MTKLYIRTMDNEFTWTQESGRQQTKPHVYDTDGTNLAAVLCAPDVDYTRTTSNDVVEILSVRDVCFGAVISSLVLSRNLAFRCL